MPRTRSPLPAALARAAAQFDAWRGKRAKRGYLTELQRHAADVAKAPSAWMPWTYRETLAGPAPPTAPPQASPAPELPTPPPA